jgi:hypothetical protein
MLDFFKNNLVKKYKITKDFQLTYGKKYLIEIRPLETILEFDYISNKYIDKDGFQYNIETVENNPDYFISLNEVERYKISCIDVWNLDERSIIVTFTDDIVLGKIGNDIINSIQILLDQKYNNNIKNYDNKNIL